MPAATTERLAPLAAVLFDLDGTLADTAPDLAEALNRLRREEGLPPLSLAEIRPQVSHGSTALIRAGFGLEPGSRRFESLQLRLLDLYRDCLAAATVLFSGMEEVLDGLEADGLRWGVVTNKPDWLTRPLLECLALDRRAACVVSGDTTNNRKPHPEPLYHAASLCGVAPGQCLYVGDAQRDVQAAEAAGMRTLVARFGYLDPDRDRPENWGADALVDHPLEILAWVRSVNRRPGA